MQNITELPFIKRAENGNAKDAAYKCASVIYDAAVGCISAAAAVHELSQYRDNACPGSEPHRCYSFAVAYLVDAEEKQKAADNYSDVLL